MKNIYIDYIARAIGVKDWQVENCVHLFEEGNTIPFISRYRKEKTGGLDDVAVAEIKHWNDVFTEMEKRKEGILSTISEQGKLTDELRSKIENCVVASELEDLYLPYRPKRRTRATMAKEKGLEPLADKMWNVEVADPEAEARKYVGDKVGSVEEALAGARDIIAERLSESQTVRENLRHIFRTRRIESKATKAASSNAEASKYRTYFNFSMPLQRIPSHNLLAILRAENEGFLSVGLDADPEKCGNKIYYDFCQEHRYPGSKLADQIRQAVDDAYKRLLEPSLTNEIVKEAKEKADIESINVFGENLTQLLLSAPVGQKRTMAIDPGFRNGCKIVCLDEQANLLHHEIIFPHPPQSEKIKSIMAVSSMIDEYAIEVIAIGNGTASRETEDFIKRVGIPENVKVFTVSEDGASIYSASKVARDEFPDKDVTVRGAVSIGRRLIDPLAELVKIEPRSIGVGQYQHDVNQTKLKKALEFTVESCVNSVGVNLNTASKELLTYVSGVGTQLAQNIVDYRAANGDFRTRRQLLNVPKLGPKAFEQCAGFLRIPDGDNPLDNTAVHPENYPLVEQMAADCHCSVDDLIRNKAAQATINLQQYATAAHGMPTLLDIMAELDKPGRDPRKAISVMKFDDTVNTFDDLREGLVLNGIVTNITQFGVFVDIGIKENGLVHISELSDHYVSTPSDVVALHQQLRVRIKAIDTERRRIALTLKNVDQQ